MILFVILDILSKLLLLFIELVSLLLFPWIISSIYFEILLSKITTSVMTRNITKNKNTSEPPVKVFIIIIELFNSILREVTVKKHKRHCRKVRIIFLSIISLLKPRRNNILVNIIPLNANRSFLLISELSVMII
jgi:hypothetical protein